MHLVLLCCASCIAARTAYRTEKKPGDILLAVLLTGVLFVIALGIPTTNLIGSNEIQAKIPAALQVVLNFFI